MFDNVIWTIWPVIILFILTMLFLSIPAKCEIIEMYSPLHDIIRTTDIDISLDIYSSTESRIEFSKTGNSAELYLVRGQKHQMFKDSLELLPYAITRSRKKSPPYFFVREILINSAIDSGLYSLN